MNSCPSRLVRALFLLALLDSEPARAQPQAPGATQQTHLTALHSEMDQAMDRVRQIVNQPVTRLARQRGMRVSEYSPGWFHPGATLPKFNTADVRATQDLSFSQHTYVTSDLNPGVVFLGAQLEFNGQLKYFYTDRSLPKKKLSEPEMLEINRLFRIIGRCEHQIAAIEHPGVDAETESESGTDANPDAEVMVRVPVPRSRYIYGGMALLVVLTLYGLYRKFGR